MDIYLEHDMENGRCRRCGADRWGDDHCMSLATWADCVDAEIRKLKARPLTVTQDTNTP